RSRLPGQDVEPSGQGPRDRRAVAPVPAGHAAAARGPPPVALQRGCRQRPGAGPRQREAAGAPPGPQRRRRRAVPVLRLPARLRACRRAAARRHHRRHRHRRPPHGGTPMTPVSLHSYLVVGAILFVLGLVGFLARRNMIIMFLSAEMMLQGVAINLVAFAHFRGNLQGQGLTLFIITVAACEAALALALIVAPYP